MTKNDGPGSERSQNIQILRIRIRIHNTGLNVSNYIDASSPSVQFEELHPGKELGT